MPTNEEYILDSGADLSPTFGSHAAQIEQAIELATPNSYRGLVIYSESTPATTGQPTGYATNWYEWHRRCLWLKPSTGEIFRFNGTTWELAKSSVAALAITNAMIANGTIQIGKLSATGGSALQIIRVNAGGTALEYVSLASALVNNSVALAKLVGSGAGKHVLVSNSGTNTWELFDAATIISLFGSNEFPVDYLAHGTALQVPMMNSGGTAIVWSSVIAGIADATLPLGKLSADPANAGKYIRYSPTTGLLEPVTLPTSAPSVTFASSGEVVTGTEAAKAIAPNTARYIAGAVRAFALITLSVNEGGSDDITACSVAAGSWGVASVTRDNNDKFTVTFSEPLFATIRTVRIYPKNHSIVDDGDLQMFVPASANMVPSSNTFTAAYVTDSSLQFTVVGLTVPSTGNYNVAIWVY